MKIKKLETVGFKSFVDRTVVHFDHDVTGIVGPNGCGKSNVVDAIKWVMGEQSAKMLRGGSMNDVIFNGSEVRGPAQFAEVSLTFDNADGLAPPEYRDYAEITVSRRLDRQGRSDYFINRTPVRLLDITNLFLGTGVGRRAYSIIEQGRIGYITTSKPEDRRAIIEEAAGVTKFKAHKKAAERKMDQTRQNLTRVDDILRELEKSLASLKRQAQKAERYKEYRAELRDLELFVGSFRYLESFTALNYVNRQLERDEATAEGIRLGMRVREIETETERLAVDRANVDVERAQQVTYALDNEVKMREARIKQLRDKLASLKERDQHIAGELEELDGRVEVVSREKADLERSLESVRDVEDEAAEALERESEALANRRRAVDDATKVVTAARTKAQEVQRRTVSLEARVEAVLRRRDELAARLEKRRGERENLAAELLDLEQDRGELAARLEGLRAGKEASAERRAECETELVRLREEAASVEAVVDSLRDVVAQKRSRLRSLLEIQEKLEGVGGGTRAIMTRYAANAEARDAAGIRGLVADLVECDEAHQAALAGVLGERLEIVVVDALENGVAALDWLRRESKGRASLVLRDHLPAKTNRRSVSAHGALGWLVDHVRFSDVDRDFVERLLGDVLIVDTLETASRLAAEMAGTTFVTLGGEVFGRDGILAGGQADDAAAHRLAMKREARELEATLAEEGRRFDEAVSRQGEVRRLVAERQAELEVARKASHDAELDLLSVEKDLTRVEGERDRMRTRVEDLAAEVQDLAYERTELDEQEAEAREAASAAREEEVTGEEEVTKAERALEDRRDAVDMQGERVTEVRLRVTQIRERAGADRAAYERVLRSEREIEQRVKSLGSEQIANAAQQGRIVGELHVDAETLSEQVASAQHAQDVLARARAVYDEARVAASQSEAELKVLRAELDDASGRVNKLSLRKAELSMAIQHLVEGIATRHEGIDVRRVLTDYHVRELPGVETLQRIDELTRLIDRMGPINLLAIDEFNEQNTRFEELSAQRKDLLDALAQLDRAIRQMNKESRALFKEAFEAIDQRFRLVFPQLFRGGEARLVLSNPDDLLESGVEIVAQPPGKKLGSLELMSGGEKALTAVALIFAIFQFKPSPFCILDEVDAPLDEANIARFADAIRQMTDRSQFIVITHSKRTMETTDVLYGVTMEQPGISKLVAVELRGNRRPVPDDRIAAA